MAESVAPPAQPPSLPPPVYLPLSPTTNAVPPQNVPDPFAGAGGVAPGDIRIARIRNSAAGPTRAANRSLRPGVVALPPLSLQALPLSAAGETNPAPIRPAPVAAPDEIGGAQSGAPNENAPDHVVPVMQLATPPPSQAAPSNTEPVTSLPSHIRITIHSDTDESGAAPGGGSDGDNYQQQALALQEHGDYARALASYQKAIRAYKAQIASGHDVDAANRGLQASETGLQICEQGQH
jgi:hypothetical protein